jgi:hypothetical protein
VTSRFGFPAFPTEALFEIPKTRSGDMNRGEYITASSKRKQVLASMIFADKDSLL